MIENSDKTNNSKNNNKTDNSKNNNKTDNSKNSNKTNNTTKQQNNHNNKNNKKQKNTFTNIIIFLVITGLIVGSYFVFFSDNHSNENQFSTYNGFSFTQNGQYWMTELEHNGQIFNAPFYIHPKTLENRNYSYNPLITKLLVGMKHQKFLIAISPDEGSTPVLAGVDIARILGKFYGIPTNSALYVEQNNRNESINYSAQIVDCSEASYLKPIIWITSSLNKTGVFLDENNPACVIVSGSVDTAEGKTTSPIVELADLLAYKILLIMK